MVTENKKTLNKPKTKEVDFFVDQLAQLLLSQIEESESKKKLKTKDKTYEQQ